MNAANGNGASRVGTSGSQFVQRTSCPICECERHEVLLDVPYFEGPIFDHVQRYYSEKGRFQAERLRGAFYKVVECVSCGLIYQEWVPNEKFLSTLYGEWIDATAAAGRNTLALGSNAKQYVQEQLLLRSWSMGRKLRILDFGMGHGRWCEMAAAFGHECYGYEFEDARSERYAAGALVKSLSYSDIAEMEFDFINAEQVFEHLTHPLQTLRYLSQSLSDRGLIRIGVPSGLSVKRNLKHGLDFGKRSRFGLNPIEPLQHLNCFTPSTLVRLGEAAGLEQHLFPLRDVIASRVDWSLPMSFTRNRVHPFYNRLRYRGGMEQYFLKSREPLDV